MKYRVVTYDCTPDHYYQKVLYVSPSGLDTVRLCRAYRNRRDIYIMTVDEDGDGCLMETPKPK